VIRVAIVTLATAVVGVVPPVAAADAGTGAAAPVEEVEAAAAWASSSR
jgi:hypothetical protein